MRATSCSARWLAPSAAAERPPWLATRHDVEVVVGDDVSYLVPRASSEEVGEAAGEGLLAADGEACCDVDEILLSGSDVEESVGVSLAEEYRLR